MSRLRHGSVVLLALSGLGFGSAAYFFGHVVVLQRDCGLGRDLACAELHMMLMLGGLIGFASIAAGIAGVTLLSRRG